MKNYLLLGGLFLLVAAAVVSARELSNNLLPNEPAFSLTATSTPQDAKKINLQVPHIWEIPDGVWVKPWNGACEEASVEMVEHFYLGDYRGIIPRLEAKKVMFPLFAIEDKLFGSNADTNSERTAKLINEYTSFEATIKKHPTLEEIKEQLRVGHPVISLHYGYDLNNPEHRFRRGGSSYHVMVITGYDDSKKIFHVNDPELAKGLDYPYTYDTILNTLHDFNHTTHKADGEPVVLFTQPKQLVKAEGGKRIYLIQDGVKRYISHPRVFTNHRWSWKAVKTISKATLDAYPSGDVISK